MALAVVIFLGRGRLDGQDSRIPRGRFHGAGARVSICRRRGNDLALGRDWRGSRRKTGARSSGRRRKGCRVLKVAQRTGNVVLAAVVLVLVAAHEARLGARQ
jgi:hypothetical protein